MNELASLESERAILALVMNTSAVDGCGAARLLLEREQLAAGDFHLPAHGAVYTASQNLLARSIPADPLNLFDAVRTDTAVGSAGGLKWLLELAQSGDSLVAQSFPGFAKQVREFSIRRKLVSQARLLMHNAADMSREVGSTLLSTNQQLASIVFRKDTFRSLTEVVDEVSKEMVRSQESKAERLLPTGIKRLDTLIGGLVPMLTVIGGRPGAGKSAIAATLVETLASGGTKVGVFSLEDRAPWLAYRLISGISGVANFTLRFRKMNDAEWNAANDGIAGVRTYSDRVLIDDRRRMTAHDIVQSARNMVVNHGVRAILIDHLLEVKPEQRLGRRDLEVADALGQFRDLSNEYEIPVVTFTQLNRGTEAKDEPTTADFKDAGAVEEMARCAIAMRRPNDGDTIQLFVIKNTNGRVGRVEVKFAGTAAMVAACEPRRSYADEAGDSDGD